MQKAKNLLLVLEKLHINPKFTAVNDGTFSKERSASIYIGEDFTQNIGCVGEVKPEIVSLFDGITSSETF